MVTNYKPKITDAEWEVMRVVWTLKQASSKEISEVLERKKDWKQATTKTLIGRLVNKGMLNTNPQGKKYIYTAAVTENENLKTVKDTLFKNICSKEIGNAISGMISEATLSHDDIKLLEETIAMKKKEAVAEIKCNCIPGQCQCKNHQYTEGNSCSSMKETNKYQNM